MFQNPGLLDGFNFYLYKSCGTLKVKKSSLGFLAILAGGKLTNREPNPEMIDPLEFPCRFHTHDDGSHKFTLTTHIILFSDFDQPPESKRYNMEHVKALNLKWMIHCLGHFELLDPERFL